MLPHVVRTERLILRMPASDDAGAVGGWFALDSEVTRYLGWRPNGSKGDTQRVVQSWTTDWRGGRRFAWVLTTGQSDSPFGMIQLRFDEHRADVGYILARDRWGEGYATEALDAVAELALGLPKMYRVSGVCDVENKASARVMEKAGFALEGVLRRFLRPPDSGSEPRDACSYAKVK